MSAMLHKQNPMQMTESEYLAFERESDIKHEFLNGQVYAMAGASWEHNQIFTATIASLYAQLRGSDCTANPSDQRVKVMETNFMSYPDISVVCGEPLFAGDEYETITNPIVIIEILSDSTEGYDRGVKFQNFRIIPTLQEYILISQDKARIEGYTRQPNGKWLLTDTIGLKSTHKIAAIDCELKLAEIYERITFADDATE